ncbi:MAG: type IV pilin [Methermicoccaceae archaeon]
MKLLKDERAVSPVIGVMLMVVVTIILAAVVSGFAGGLATDQTKAPQTSLTTTLVINSIEDTNTSNWQSDYPDGYSADNYILFESIGGDGFALSEIEVQIQTQDTKTTIGLDDSIPDSVRSEDDAANATTCLPSTITAYLTEIGSTDGYIMPGDKFALHADNNRIDSIGSQISWRPEGGAGGFAVYKDTTIEYKVIHKPSGKAIATGRLEVV